jgi:hypothetical protein
MDINPLFDEKLAKIFSLGCLLIMVIVFFALQRLFIHAVLFVNSYYFLSYCSPIQKIVACA